MEESTLIEEMVGRKIENLYPKADAEIGPEVMRVEHLSVPHPTIKGKNIVDDISFNVHKGEILGIGGLVGVKRLPASSDSFRRVFTRKSLSTEKRYASRNRLMR